MTCLTDVSGELLMPDGSSVSYDGLPANQFRCLFPKVPNTVFFLQSWEVPGVSIIQVDRETPYLLFDEIGEKMNYTPFTIRFLIDKNMKNYKEIHDWMKRISVSQTQKDETSDAFIFTGDNKIIRFIDCWPSDLSSIEFITNVEVGNIQYLTASCTFAFDYYEYL